jgi:hypothetical protein
MPRFPRRFCFSVHRRHTSPCRGPALTGKSYRPRIEILEGRWLPSTVTNLNDSGAGSLRDAIAATSAGGTVDFQPGLTGTISLTSGLTIDKSLTITGPGAKIITISGRLDMVNATDTVAITGLTIAHSLGGGIDNVGTLTLASCAISHNELTSTHSGVPGGAGIHNTGTLTVTNSTLSDNSLVDPYEGFGGGIWNHGTLTISNSTLSGNSAAGGLGLDSGGGIYNDSGTLTVINSTISGNTAVGPGMAIGGGIAINAGSVTLTNTIVAGNTGVTVADVSGTVTQADHDLIGNGDGSMGLVNGQNGNQVGTTATPVSPKLGPLQDNGSPTQTMALLPGSPALDAGNNSAPAGATDQRGLPRIVNGVIDIGAYEYQSTRFFALGGAPGRVQVRRDGSIALLADFAPYGATYTDGVAVAVGDVNGDGFPDLITGATVGNPHVKVYDGKALATGTFDSANPDASLLASFFAYGLNFNVGANVAAGDMEHNGFADIVTGASAGNPDVHVYRGKDIANHAFDPNGASLIAQFFPYGLGFNIGVNVAVGDVNKDGFADLVTGPTAGNPDVRVYDGKALTTNPGAAPLLAQWFAYGLNFNVGAFVAVGDVNGDGYGDVITGASAGNPDVRVYDGEAIATGTFDGNHPENSQLEQFFAYDLQFNVGAAVAAADFEANGKFDLLTGASIGSPHYRIVQPNATGVKPPALVEDIVSDLQGGVLVGA